MMDAVNQTATSSISNPGRTMALDTNLVTLLIVSVVLLAFICALLAVCAMCIFARSHSSTMSLLRHMLPSNQTREITRDIEQNDTHLEPEQEPIERHVQRKSRRTHSSDESALVSIRDETKSLLESSVAHGSVCQYASHAAMSKYGDARIELCNNSLSLYDSVPFVQSHEHAYPSRVLESIALRPQTKEVYFQRYAKPRMMSVTVQTSMDNLSEDTWPLQDITSTSIHPDVSLVSNSPLPSHKPPSFKAWKAEYRKSQSHRGTDLAIIHANGTNTKAPLSTATKQVQERPPTATKQVHGRCPAIDYPWPTKCALKEIAFPDRINQPRFEMKDVISETRDLTRNNSVKELASHLTQYFGPGHLLSTTIDDDQLSLPSIPGSYVHLALPIQFLSPLNDITLHHTAGSFDSTRWSTVGERERILGERRYGHTSTVDISNDTQDSDAPSQTEVKFKDSAHLCKPSDPCKMSDPCKTSVSCKTSDSNLSETIPKQLLSEDTDPILRRHPDRSQAESDTYVTQLVDADQAIAMSSGRPDLALSESEWHDSCSQDGSSSGSYRSTTSARGITDEISFRTRLSSWTDADSHYGIQDIILSPQFTYRRYVPCGVHRAALSYASS